MWFRLASWCLDTKCPTKLQWSSYWDHLQSLARSNVNMRCNLAVGRVFYGKDNLYENLAATWKVCCCLFGRLGIGYRLYPSIWGDRRWGMKTRQGLVSRDRLRRESEASADSPEMELEIPEGRVLPLNSKQLMSVQLQVIPWALDLPARGSWEDIRLTIEGKLREDYNELSVQVAVQEISETETKVISDWQERSVPGGWCWVKRGECTCRVGGQEWRADETKWGPHHGVAGGKPETCQSAS